MSCLRKKAMGVTSHVIEIQKGRSTLLWLLPSLTCPRLWLLLGHSSLLKGTPEGKKRGCVLLCLQSCTRSPKLSSEVGASICLQGGNKRFLFTRLHLHLRLKPLSGRTMGFLGGRGQGSGGGVEGMGWRVQSLGLGSYTEVKHCPSDLRPLKQSC